MFDEGGGATAPAPMPDIEQALAKLDAGKGTINDQATVMNGSAANLVAAAGTGFTLDPEAATALISSCEEALNVLGGVAYDLQAVRAAPRLGDTRGARSVSPFTQRVAVDSHGITTAVHNLQGTITQMLDAYKKAVANYQAIEQQVKDSVNTLDQEVKQQNAPAPQRSPIRLV
jgi:hypothetical protein